MVQLSSSCLKSSSSGSYTNAYGDSVPWQTIGPDSGCFSVSYDQDVCAEDLACADSTDCEVYVDLGPCIVNTIVVYI